MDIRTVEARRDAVLEAMRGIRALRPGTVTEQFLPVRHRGQREPVRRGPYYLWQYYEQGRPVRQRLTSPEAVAQARAEVEAHRRFQALCQEFEELTRLLGQLERESQTGDVAQAVKKKPKRPSSRTRR